MKKIIFLSFIISFLALFVSAFHCMYKTYNTLMTRNFNSMLMSCAHYSTADSINLCFSAITQVCTDRCTSLWIINRSIFNFFTNFSSSKVQSGCCCCLYSLMDQLAAQIPCILICCNIAHIYLKNTCKGHLRKHL